MWMPPEFDVQPCNSMYRDTHVQELPCTCTELHNSMTVSVVLSV